MHFLNPSLFAVLLPLVGIPLFIHWLSRRYPKKFLFSSVEEIRRTLVGRSRLFRWRHRLMLLLRTLAVLALLLAFLQPIVASRHTQSGVKRHLILLVDHSLSMSHSESGGSARSRAVGEVRRLLDSLDADDHFNVIRVDHAPTAAFAAFSTHRKAALDFLEHSRPPLTHADFHAANQLAGVLAREADGPVDVYYFSDFQRRNWADVNFAGLPDGVRLFFVAATDDPRRGNRAITGLGPGQGAVIAGGEMEVKLRVANFAPQPWSGTAEVGFGPAHLRDCQITLAPWSEGDFTVVVPVPAGGLLQLTAALPQDDLPADDRRHLAVRVREREEVVILTGPEDDPQSPAPSLFLTTAVDPYGGDLGAYRPKHLAPETLNPAAVAASSRLIASRLPLLSDPQAGTLVTFLRGGGGVILFLDGPADAANLDKLGELTGEPMPIRLTERLAAEHLPSGAMRVASGDFRSRFLRLFEGERRQNLAHLEFYDLYHAVSTGGGSILLTYADGTPALAETTIGLGTLLICNFSVAEASSNLARQRLFPAWIHEMLLSMHQTGGGGLEPFMVGDAISGETWAAEAAGRDLLGPDGAPARVRANVHGERIRLGFTAAAPGFYHLPGEGGRDLLVFAVNPDADQSDLRSIDPAVLPDRAGNAKTEASFVGNTTDYALLLRGKPVFHWFVLAALGLLLIENLLFKSPPRTS